MKKLAQLLALAEISLMGGYAPYEDLAIYGSIKAKNSRSGSPRKRRKLIRQVPQLLRSKKYR